MSRAVPHLLYVADSRARGFDRYSPPSDSHITITYIIKRGATVQQLLPLVLHRLRQWNDRRFIIIRVAAGINNLTDLYTPAQSTGSTKVLIRSQVSSQDLIAIFKTFKSAILQLRQKAIVIFSTIPPASFAKFQESRSVSYLPRDTLHNYQCDLNATIDIVNDEIKTLNHQFQHGISFHTLSLHTTIRKPTKRRRRSGNRRESIRNDFAPLYDGLHAKSHVKQRWFFLLHKLFKQDVVDLHPTYSPSTS